jgi:hypothetical protein
VLSLSQSLSLSLSLSLCLSLKWIAFHLSGGVCVRAAWSIWSGALWCCGKRDHPHSPGCVSTSRISGKNLGLSDALLFWSNLGLSDVLLFWSNLGPNGAIVFRLFGR